MPFSRTTALLILHSATALSCSRSLLYRSCSIKFHPIARATLTRCAHHRWAAKPSLFSSQNFAFSSIASFSSFTQPTSKLSSTSSSGSVVVPQYSSSLVLSCETESQLEFLGNQLSEHLTAGDVILLKGDLGAGKTTLSRGIVRSLSGDPTMRVTSPSYLLDNTYSFGEDLPMVHHMDLYRLPNGCDLSILGIPGIFQTSICLIEWPERMGMGSLPEEYLEVDIRITELARSSREGVADYDDDDGDEYEERARRVTLVAHGSRWVNRLENLSAEQHNS